MGFKKYERRPTFLDMELSKVIGQSRTQRFLSEVDSAIDWKPIGEMITSQYPVGHSVYGNRAYPPLMLLKALLIQKWFGIPSDPELENQINDRFSFKTFIGLPLSDPSPDHSILSRFRTRIEKEHLEDVHHVLLQFQGKGFSIESGMAVDARLVKSASKPLGKDKLKERKEEKERGTNKPAKFQRALWQTYAPQNRCPLFLFPGVNRMPQWQQGILRTASIVTPPFHGKTIFSQEKDPQRSPSPPSQRKKNTGHPGRYNEELCQKLLRKDEQEGIDSSSGRRHPGIRLSSPPFLAKFFRRQHTVCHRAVLRVDRNESGGWESPIYDPRERGLEPLMPGHGVQYQKGDSQSEQKGNPVSGVIGKVEKVPRGLCQPEFDCERAV